jgi:methionine-rich copper-binding protein CopC/ketosteroid isomerase-like protein
MLTLFNIQRQLRLFTIVCVGLFSATAFAHTSLKSSVPADGQTVPEVRQISVEFGAAIRLMAFTLTDASGNTIPTDFARTSINQSRFDIGVGTQLSHTSYRIAWMAMGDDGHKIDGTFRFTVDPTASATAHIAAQEDKPVLWSGMELDAAKAVLQFHKALKDGDKATVKRLLADKVMIFEGGGVERSEAEYEHHHMSADMAYLKEMSVKTLEHHVTVSGTSAVSLSRSKVNGTYKGKIVDREGMETITLQKQDDAWLITHIHWSN